MRACRCQGTDARDPGPHQALRRRSRALDGATFTAPSRPPRRASSGPNGAGKTTTMRCVFGLATPDARRASAGTAPRSTRGPACGSATCPSSAASTRGCGSLEQLAYFGQHHGLSSREAAKTKAGEWLERFGLADRAKSKLEDLSHGNQQRVQLATALVHDPELLVLDEPFSGLDPIGIATMAEVLRERAAGRRRRRLRVAPAGPRRGGLRGRRDHQPRAGRRRGRDRGAQGAPRGGGTSTSRSRAPAARGSTGSTTTRSSSGTATASSCSSTSARTSTRCSRRLAPRARSAASATSRRKLSELFMEAVTAPQPMAPDGAPVAEGVR